MGDKPKKINEPPGIEALKQMTEHARLINILEEEGVIDEEEGIVFLDVIREQLGLEPLGGGSPKPASFEQIGLFMDGIRVTAEGRGVGLLYDPNYGYMIGSLRGWPKSAGGISFDSIMFSKNIDELEWNWIHNNPGKTDE